FLCEPALSEILIALLSTQAFDTFQENEKGLAAYLPVAQHESTVDEYIDSLRQQFDFSYDRVLLVAQNWNAVWESNFQPIVVDEFCAIRADFHPAITDVQHEILIQPKMAFGTGHHATTFQMIRMMEGVDFSDKKVLDYGCGTGVLAILASKLNAKHIDAIDIDEWAEENTLENAKLNGVSNVNAMLGDLALVKGRQYDLILANITFNVISDSLPSLYDMLPEAAFLLSSGFFQADAEQLIEQATELGLVLKRQMQREGWVCLAFQKL
ncbi:MAG: 50S ribosomal protein L11 methyltransferase, partial [Bacteroidota bacterium]